MKRLIILHWETKKLIDEKSINFIQIYAYKGSKNLICIIKEIKCDNITKSN